VVAKARKLKPVIVTEPLKLDLGAGTNPKEGFKRVDIKAFPGTDYVCDLRKGWLWKDGEVAEIYMSHVLEHFTGMERVHIFNEIDRVLQKGGTATIITPSWASCRAYGDPTHAWPPVSEMTYQYLNKAWRLDKAPDTDISWRPDGFKCDLQAVVGWSGFHPELAHRSDQVKNWWFTFGKEAAFDLLATLTKP
jgi:hypothetical protein